MQHSKQTRGGNSWDKHFKKSAGCQHFRRRARSVGTCGGAYVARTDTHCDNDDGSECNDDYRYGDTPVVVSRSDCFEHRALRRASLPKLGDARLRASRYSSASLYRMDHAAKDPLLLTQWHQNWGQLREQCWGCSWPPCWGCSQQRLPARLIKRTNLYSPEKLASEDDFTLVEAVSSGWWIRRDCLEGS